MIDNRMMEDKTMMDNVIVKKNALSRLVDLHISRVLENGGLTTS